MALTCRMTAQAGNSGHLPQLLEGTPSLLNADGQLAES